eukprot:scaffold597798_cov28-Prasinocladus_malaysianus.AAC.2
MAASLLEPEACTGCTWRATMSHVRAGQLHCKPCLNFIVPRLVALRSQMNRTCALDHLAFSWCMVSVKDC